MVGRLPQRRGWFYTGGGLPLNNDGTLDTSGRMGIRVIGPATGTCYATAILEEWTDKDDRFRCLYMDAAVFFFGQQVALVHDSAVNSQYTLVGEAIPQSGVVDDAPAFPSQYAARRGAPWFALAGIGSGPWWNLLTVGDNPGRTSSSVGYNVGWETDWDTTPIYFGVQDNGYLDLHKTFSAQIPAFPGDNLGIGWIYDWIRKDATPVSWSGSSIVRKIGAAFDYATGRTDVSRFANSSRIIRIARF